VSRKSLLLVVGLALVCAWSGWVSAFHRDTVAAEVTWLASLGAVILVDLVLWAGRRSLPWGLHLDAASEPWPRPGRGGGLPALSGASPWAALVLVALAWDVLALDTPPRQYHLTISALSQAYRPLNAALFLVWMGIGVGYGVTRARVPVDPSHDAAGGPNVVSGTSHTGAVVLVTATVSRHPALAGRTVPGLLLPHVPAVGVVFWAVLPVVAIAIDQLARRSGGRIANAEEMLRFISTATPAKVLLVVAWGFAGYHLFAR
jgi:hypothetical protein